VAINESKAIIQRLQAQLGAARSMTSVSASDAVAAAAPPPQVAPNWVPVAPAPMVVAASAHEAPQPPKFVIPDILRGPSYGESGNSRLTQSMFTRKV
jgi:hypothetical protein